MKNKKDQPNFECSAYQYMAEDWAKTADIFAGVRRLREKEYLTRFYKESDEDYNARRKATEFFNVFAGNVTGIVGTVLTKDAMPKEPPKALAEMFADIDLCGSDLESFLRVTFTNAVRDGHSFILVDAPPKANIENATLADVADRRAFWVNYKASQAINWQYEISQGKLVLNQITFKECTKQADGAFGEKETVRYRVLKRGSYSLFVEERDEQTKETKITPEVEDAPTGLDEIPLAVCYAKQTAPLESTPPLMELLETNLTHYNSQSVLRQALKYVVPMPVFKVDSKEDAAEFLKITAAANRSIIVWGEHADAKYLELEGKSVEALRTDIQDIEARMAKLGIEKFAPVTDAGAKTAYEVGSDNRKQMSEIAIMARNLETCVEQAFYFTAQVTNAVKGAGAINLTDAEKTTLRLNIDYDKLTFSIEQLNFFKSLVDGGYLSKETLLNILPTICDMPKDWTVEAELERLGKEKPAEDDFDARFEEKRTNLFERSKGRGRIV